MKKSKLQYIIITTLFFVLNITNTYFLTTKGLNRYIVPFEHTIIGTITAIIGNFSFLLFIFVITKIIFRKDKHQKWGLVGVTFLLNLLIFVLGIFNLYYGTSFTKSSFDIFNNPAGGIAIGMFSEIFYEFLNYYRFLVFIPFVVILVLAILFNKIEEDSHLLKNIKIKTSTIIMSILLFFIAFTSYTIQIKSHSVQIDSMTSTFGVQNMGVYPYYIANFIGGDKDLITKESLNIKSDNDLIDNYQSINKNKDTYINPIDNKTYGKEVTSDQLASNLYIADELNYQNTLTGLFEDKNLVLVQLESINQFLIELDPILNDRMPFLKALLKESFVFKNLYANVGMGVSSDAEVSVLTGLYPEGSSTLYWNVDKNNYQFDTIPKYFNNKGYKTQAIHGDKGHFYNRDNVYLKDNLIGFSEDYHDITHFDEDLIKNGYEILPGVVHKSPWVSDIYLADMLYDHSKQYDKFMLFPLLMMPHVPFEFNPINIDRPSYDIWLAGKNKINKRTEKFINYADYLDLFFKRMFLDEFDNIRTLEDTVFIFYGDHGSTIKNGDLSTLYNKRLTVEEEREILHKTLTFIYAPGTSEVNVDGYTIKEGLLKGSQNLVRDQIDLHRTIVDLFNLNNNDDYLFGTHGLSNEPGFALENRVFDLIFDNEFGEKEMMNLKEYNKYYKKNKDTKEMDLVDYVLRFKRLNDLLYKDDEIISIIKG